MDAADKFKSGTLTEEYIKSLSTPDAKKALMTINGVGKQGQRLYTFIRSWQSRLIPR